MVLLQDDTMQDNTQKNGFKHRFFSQKFWESGASTILFYICLMWLIAMAFMFFVELYAAFSGSGKTQLYADILADGAAYAGNNGWGLDIDAADNAFETLVALNDSDLTDNVFDNVLSVSLDYSNTEDDGSVNDRDPDSFNTANSTVEWSSTLLTDDSESLANTSTASTRITYSGGVEIVLEAWHHTYQYWKNEPYPDEYQTWYVWGGGHGNDTEWTQYADCSGFVSGVYRACGYNVSNWYCTSDLEHLGTVVAEGTGASVFSNTQPGDIILFWYSGSSSGGSAHTGIYAGEYEGQPYMVHCSGSGSSMNSRDPSIAGHGETRGAILAQIDVSRYSNIKIMRVVDSQGTAAQTSTQINGLTDDEVMVYKLMKEAGYSDVAIAALMGNLRYESAGGYANMVQGHVGDTSYNEWYAQQFATGAMSEYDFVYNGPNGGGYGLAQWTDHYRKTKLWEFSGGDVSDVSAQVRLLLWELKVGDSLDNYTRVGMYLQGISSSDQLDKASDYVLRNFEGIWNDSYTARRQNAHDIYNAICNQYSRVTA